MFTITYEDELESPTHAIMYQKRKLRKLMFNSDDSDNDNKDDSDGIKEPTDEDNKDDSDGIKEPTDDDDKDDSDNDIEFKFMKKRPIKFSNNLSEEKYYDNYYNSLEHIINDRPYKSLEEILDETNDIEKIEDEYNADDEYTIQEKYIERDDNLIFY
jgi:hypothetical protein